MNFFFALVMGHALGQNITMAEWTVLKAFFKVSGFVVSGGRLLILM
jgi:hypothetical protein